MPDALRIGLLGPLQVRDGAGNTVHVGGRQLRVLLILRALDAGRVVPSGSLAGQIWPDEPPEHPGNTEAQELLADRFGVDPSAQLKQVYLRILRDEERLAAAVKGPVRPRDLSFDPERTVVPARAARHIPGAGAR